MAQSAAKSKIPFFLDFCHSVKFAGRQFDLRDRPWLFDLYTNDYKQLVVKKAAQLGLSSLAILRALYRAAYEYPAGVLYLLPTDSHAEKFAKAKIAPLLADNAHLAALIDSASDTLTTKRIGGRGHLYIYGTRVSGHPNARLGLKSFSADEIIYDERDEMDDAQVVLAHERMADSEFQREFSLSTPLIPDYGVDAAYNDSDRRVWEIKCPACGRAVCLELDFPGCLQRRGILLPDGRQGTEVYRACRHCRAEVNPARGKWRAQSPGKGVAGYWISQLCSSKTEPASILEMYESGKNLQVLYNDKLGMAYIEATNRLSLADIYSLCGTEPMAESSPGPCSMGVDQNDSRQEVRLNVVIGARTGVDKGRIYYVGEMADWLDLDVLMRKYNVQRCVIDGQPQTTMARKFAERNPGRVWLWYHDEAAKHDRALFNHQTGQVIVHRTVHLDQSHAEITQQRLVLPRQGTEAIKELAEHCTRVVRKLESKDKPGMSQGVTMYRWIRTGADHYRQALSYESLARQDLLPMRSDGRPLNRGMNLAGR